MWETQEQVPVLCFFLDFYLIYELSTPNTALLDHCTVPYFFHISPSLFLLCLSSLPYTPFLPTYAYLPSLPFYLSLSPPGPLLPPLLEPVVWVVGVQPNQVAISNIQLLWYQLAFNMSNHGSSRTWGRDPLLGSEKVDMPTQNHKIRGTYNFCFFKFFPNRTTVAPEQPWAPYMHHIPYRGMVLKYPH